MFFTSGSGSDVALSTLSNKKLSHSAKNVLTKYFELCLVEGRRTFNSCHVRTKFLGSNV
jgi:hypothetical protein